MSAEGSGSASASPPLVSVVIPAHNAESTIREQLNALADQVDAPRYEVIVSLNRCTDRTREVVEAFQGRISALKIVESNSAPGASHARNVGIDHAIGGLVLFGDADDIVDSRWVTEMCDALQHRDLVGGRLVTLAPPDSRVGRLFPARQTQTLPVARGRIRFAVSASLGCRRDLLDRIRFDERYTHGADDFVFTLRAQAAGASVGFAEHALCHYRIRPNARAVARQLASYASAEADFIANEEPFTDRGPTRDVSRLLRSVLGLGLSRSTDDLIRRAVLLRASVAKAHRLDEHRRARGNRWASLADPPMAEPPVRFTLPLDLPIIGGCGCIADFADASWFFEGGDMREQLDLLAQCALEGAAVLDVGADVGLFSIAAARTVGPAGTVTSFEPDVGRHQLFRANVSDHRCETIIDLMPATVSLQQVEGRTGITHRHVDLVRVSDEAFDHDRSREVLDSIDVSSAIVVLSPLRPGRTSSVSRSAFVRALIKDHELWALGTAADASEPSPALDQMSATLVGLPPTSPMAPHSYLIRVAARIDPGSAQLSSLVGVGDE